ncbi:3-dehydroquinate synthase [Enterococcus hulanensis]|uniref:3-dehydroquinate synthase n=1 Tax=Enterococcus hulanensis TaxID=2559929 RepID=A0ABU3EYM1_9ENTE|nr:3-dehydroquinate synthase [Enterococcus hulanensis]MDT2599766.1 3-dehydroquinate synthase [Enterococcus hulanensis]MDT2609378.1 3-dehydroquinate synthase [Enterococcus hulanensis]MDT2615955.1 3-dehydroquinate synthase [Enterococcus hulanensis]MDT2628005.1 3-dehydroquinate synthase [Enterococcus hulanensis]MDT2655110.1 3-dehydroquinate synthase [Enterococcus hulanensis]
MEIVLPDKSYEIIVKRHALNTVGEWIASLWQNKKIAIISDEHVFPLYGEKIQQQLADYEVCHYTVPAGESSKSLEMANNLYDFLADQQFTRSDAIIALGGGVVGDLASFVASTYMRGIAFVQIPTSLLAQVDSSIGGKTAVNSSKAKNMIGTFAQPDGVLIDPETLNTLPELRVREGIAEIIKCGAISDASLWNDLEKLTGIQDLLAHSEAIILKALEVKKTVVEEDEFDNGSRLLLNFGHTIGHAIENTAGYGKISHGEAVAIGMVKISQTAERKNLSPVGITDKINAMNQKYQLPITYQPWEAEKFYTAITHDKKARGNSLNIILLAEIGKAYIKKIKLTEIKEFIVEGE